MRREGQRSTIDVNYLKAVLVDSFQRGELVDHNERMLPVLARLLAFSPQDVERAKVGIEAANSPAPMKSFFKF